MKLATRAFTHVDQLRFAGVSGDRNPMHMDALQARRTQAGAPVVHGIHMLLWALDTLAANQPDLPPLRSVRAQFNKFVYLGERVEIDHVQQSARTIKLQLAVDSGARSRISIQFGEANAAGAEWPDAALEEQPPLTSALNLNLDDAAGREGKLAFQMRPEDAAALFPNATRWLGAPRIAAIAATTFLVGMVCPGLHSIYSELAIETCAQSTPEAALAYRVTEVDPRFHSIDQQIAGGGLSGTVKGFFRTPPVEQSSMAVLKGVVRPEEFAGSVALIVGGSRGLGELTAKLIATGGGQTIVTWKSGKHDAERVANEIRSAGGLCATLLYDAAKPAAVQLAGLDVVPTHAYYFATPAIFRPQAEIFATDRLREFMTIYVEGFWDLAQALRARQPKLSLFYPSSTAVAERPRGMTDYAAAKAAGEVLSADINAHLAPMHVTIERLPRLPTDQTASITEVETASALDTMLPIVREVQSWPR